MTKTYMITKPEVMEQAQKIVNLRPEFEQREKELQARYQKEADELSQEFNARKDILWDKLIEQVGLTPRDENGERPGYTIDNGYFAEHGVVFIVHEDKKEEPCDCPGCRALREGGERPMSLAEILGMGGDD